MYHYVYQVTNLINGKIYVGKHSTEDLDDGYMGSGKLLTLAIKKHGIENFRKHIVKMCETTEEALEFEMNLVNEEFITRNDTYNLALGGKSGFSTSEVTTVEERLCVRAGRLGAINRNKSVAGRRCISERNRRMHAEGKIHCPDWTGKRHSEESKRKIGEANSKRQTGSGNSQFHTVWIYNLDLQISKKIKRSELDVFVQDGWAVGRKMKF